MLSASRILHSLRCRTSGWLMCSADTSISVPSQRSESLLTHWRSFASTQGTYFLTRVATVTSWGVDGYGKGRSRTVSTRTMFSERAYLRMSSIQSSCRCTATHLDGHGLRRWASRRLTLRRSISRRSSPFLFLICRSSGSVRSLLRSNADSQSLMRLNQQFTNPSHAQVRCAPRSSQRRSPVGSCPKIPMMNPQIRSSDGLPQRERRPTVISPDGHALPDSPERRPRRERQRHYRPEVLELLQRPAGRRPVLPGLHRATDLPFVPEDGRRADQATVQSARDRTRWSGLGCTCASRRRRPGGPVPAHAGRTWEAARHARRHLPQGAEQDPGPGEAQATRLGPDRQRDLDDPRRRREGRRLRGAAGQERGGCEVGCG